MSSPKKRTRIINLKKLLANQKKKEIYLQEMLSNPKKKRKMFYLRRQKKVQLINLKKTLSNPKKKTSLGNLTMIPLKTLKKVKLPTLAKRSQSNPKKKISLRDLKMITLINLKKTLAHQIITEMMNVVFNNKALFFNSLVVDS